MKKMQPSGGSSSCNPLRLKTLVSDVTFGVCSAGNTQGLLLTLQSVLLGTQVPGAINIRLEGAFPSFAQFYLEQLAELARIAGVDWNMNVALSKGVRAARDWQLDACRTDWLWMGDDDVIYDSSCLAAFEDGKVRAADAAFFAGSKADVNNRRGYPDHSKTIRSDKDTQAPYYSFFAEGGGPNVSIPQVMVDTGNAMFRLAPIRQHSLWFSQFPDGFNYSGDDALFSLLMHDAGLRGYFLPHARAFHLEKPGDGRAFSETAARAEAVLRSAQLLALDVTPLGKDFLAYEQKS